MKRTLIAAALAVGLAMPAGAQLSGEWMADNLTTGCLPMQFHVDLGTGLQDNESLQRKLRLAARSRLRAAGVYNADPNYMHSLWFSNKPEESHFTSHLRRPVLRFSCHRTNSSTTSESVSGSLLGALPTQNAT